MNRYEFENYISEYIDNELSLSKRKEFETFINDNPETLELLKAIKLNKERLRNLPKLKVKEAFNQKLLMQIKKNKHNRLGANRNFLIFGFTPIYASLMAVFAIAFFFISNQLFFPKQSNNYIANKSNQEYHPQGLDNTSIVDEEGYKKLNQYDSNKDSKDIDSTKNRKIDYSKNMQFVND